MMTEAELEAIRARCERASGGPWVSFVEGRDHTSGCDFIQTDGEDITLSGATVADQDFIAAARQDTPALIEEIYRLRALIHAAGLVDREPRAEGA
jgi:hypothetical protein